MNTRRKAAMETLATLAIGDLPHPRRITAHWRCAHPAQRLWPALASALLVSACGSQAPAADSSDEPHRCERTCPSGLTCVCGDLSCAKGMCRMPPSREDARIQAHDIAPGSSDSGGAAGDTAGGRADAPVVGSAIDSTIPLLSRPARPRHTCTVSRPLSLLDAEGGSAELLQRGEQPYLVHVNSGVLVSSLDFDGKLGAAVTLHDPIATSLVAVLGAASSESAVVAWSETSDLTPMAKLGWTRIDAPAAHFSLGRLPKMLEEESWPLLAAGGRGYLLAYVGAHSGLHMVALNPDATIGGDLQSLETPAYLPQLLDLSATASGFMLAYSPPPTELGAQAVLQALDADGKPLAPSAPLGDGVFGVQLIARGDQLFAAWSTLDAGASANRSLIRIATVPAHGGAPKVTYHLQAGVRGQTQGTPRWVDLGGDLGLAWLSRGNAPNCVGACPTPATLHFVILDARDLTPVSAVLELTGPASRDVRRIHRLAARAGDVLVATSIDGDRFPSASATIHCTQ